MGSGAFGRVLKAVVTDLRDDEPKSTVAVKMCKTANDQSHIRNLAIELKIMIHLGKHLNIVNLLGAYTTEIVKGELQTPLLDATHFVIIYVYYISLFIYILLQAFYH